jgi:hypothetical protein
MLGHASDATTLDVDADLFDSDLSSVAESVGKMWDESRGRTNIRRKTTLYQRRQALKVRAPCRFEMLHRGVDTRRSIAGEPRCVPDGI